VNDIIINTELRNGKKVFCENEMERRKVRHYISPVGLGLQACKLRARTTGLQGEG